MSFILWDPTRDMLAEDGVSGWESIELLPRLPRETRIPGFHVATPKNPIYRARPHRPRSTPSVLLEAPYYLWTRGLWAWKERTTERRDRRSGGLHKEPRELKRDRSRNERDGNNQGWEGERTREGKERAGEQRVRAEHNGPPRRFGNVETHDPE